jgi:hypothetical protein
MSNRATARAEIQLSAQVNGELLLRVERRYVYDHPNCGGVTAYRIVPLRPVQIAVALDHLAVIGAGDAMATVAACPRARRRAVPVVEEAARRPTEAGLAAR